MSLDVAGVAHDVAAVPSWVNGEPRILESERSGSVTNPATGEVIRSVAFATPEDVDATVDAARVAFRAWRRTSLAQRTRILFAFRELLNQRKDELAALITQEHGKLLEDAAGEVARGLEVVEFACGMPHLLKGSYSSGASTGVDVHSIRRPLGVTAVVSPFNFPAMVPMWFVPIAIAAGNTVVVKPSEKDPSPATWLGSVWAEAGLPAGAYNVVHGDGVAVDALITHPAVRAVSFVGSTPVARHVYETASRHGKRVQALGGAKNHMVVLPDADPAAAATAAVSAGFGSAGERCMAVSVVVAVEPGADALVAAIAERMASIRVGDGRGAHDMGPLITAAHRDRVAAYLETGVAEGAELIVDGRTHFVDGDPGGFWLGPSLFDRVVPTMSVYTDEIFGPVLSVVRAGSLDEAIQLVNGNPYGNGSAIFTSDGGAARRFSEEVETGMVGVNVPIPVPVAYYSFGGWKSSLFGDAHAHGTEGVQFYTRGQVVTSRWPEAETTALDLAFPRQS